MIDITLLRILSTRSNLKKVSHSIIPEVLTQETQKIIKSIVKYYSLYSDHDKIDFVQFKDSFKAWNKIKDAKKLGYYNKVIDQMAKSVSTVTVEQVAMQMAELKYAATLIELLDSYDSGDEINIVAEVDALTKGILETNSQSDSITDWITPDLDNLVVQDTSQGLTWADPRINACLRPLVGGDAMIVAGRPGKGKTTLLTQHTTHMASQLNDRPVLWCNNEGPGERIVRRSMQSALNATMSELQKKSDAGTLHNEYFKALGGKDRFRVKDIHGMWNYQVEQLIRAHNPKVVVMDMIDKIKFAGLSKNVAEDIRLEEMYGWARDLATEYDFVLIATSQISVEGQGLPFPTESMLKGSKTGKQGATDTIMMLGHSNDPAQEQLRWLSTPKSKWDIEGADLLELELRMIKDRGRLT